MQIERRTYTLAEVAEMLGVSTDLVRKAARAGQIRNIRLGRRVLIPVEAVEEFLNQGSTDV